MRDRFEDGNGMQDEGARRPRLGQLRMAEQVASILRQRILSQSFGDGAMLPKQDEIVAEFGVSSPSVREALRILETEGLITIRRGSIGGAEVHAPNASTAGYGLGLALQATGTRVADLGATMTLLEPLTIAGAALREDRGEVIVPVLRRLLNMTEDLLADDVGFTRVSREFHETAVSFCDNATQRLLMMSLTAIWTVQEDNWAETAAGQGEYPDLQSRKAVLKAHTRITEEIEKGNVEKVEQLARAHLSATQLYVYSALGDAVIDAVSPKARAHYRDLASR